MPSPSELTRRQPRARPPWSCRLELALHGTAHRPRRAARRHLPVPSSRSLVRRAGRARHLPLPRRAELAALPHWCRPQSSPAPALSLTWCAGLHAFRPGAAAQWERLRMEVRVARRPRSSSRPSARRPELVLAAPPHQ
uniref:Uncharacterized protein n=1 Tax=Arundo donax TaxID=35708 RepID=A0A0A9CEM2_ARUDO